MESLPLSFAVLLSYLRQVVEQIADPRQPSNGTRYKLSDGILGAFSVFFMQCESFLEHQRQMQSQRGKDNAQSLFGIAQIPSSAQIRNLLDEVAAVGLFAVFFQVYAALMRGGYFKSYQQWNGDLLVALDGTEYFKSQKIHCQYCSSRTHKNGKVTYVHQAILPAIVAPDQPQVIALVPEFVTPQDGHEKQDCEVAAAKRWISTHAARFGTQGITLLGDDLYSHQPLCEHCLQHQLSFIFTCLPQSHPALYDWLGYLDANGEVKTLEQAQWNKRTKEIYRYRYVNQIPLRDTQPALQVNWCELTVVRESDGKVLYTNAWVTDHDLTPATVPHVVSAGRSRWKTENENHNVLKTKGYHLEHNFGHGQHHLAATLLTLNLLAFLFHTVLHLVDLSYQQIRHKRGTRRGFFQDILALTKYLWFESWQHLLNFMLSDSPPAQTADSS
ncbi:ISNCY family transposase [Leptodesmis sichuanensis]|uniref:ISNCY family transposase n=1 Tax=Leptodesmis sichuanensis TaxID=2906798 RepID=UPI001F40EC09|nr:ISNCY family transposase [Leptodesmis sichuanensis]UIE36042.1 ISNCY family transposase [Leptodesmis sichuanensis A121]UIE36151.1 ISNCY family transposase [Leptodesmis sichuanensis A121]UIE36699.1 ISNCY family transposase [Leptodesmis sichuanensis A121]UIE37649.1 ISNCY family transposase [Leptodesmis sichuanensis A121]UIE38100.1 ISNCY family transposase [Leptodesmis sichuanensis A121]